MTEPPLRPRPRLLRRCGCVVAGALLGAGGLLLGFASATRGEETRRLEPVRLSGAGSAGAAEPAGLGEDEVLRVVTWNLAHGRGEAFHQAGLGRERIEANLSGVAGVLRTEAPHLVALQEADGPSWWSGGFDHVARLGEGAGLPLAIRAGNVEGWGLSYGAALLSGLPCVSAEQGTFAATPPTPAKGFVRATFRWGDRELDVISVHLDFARAKVRERQLARLGQALRSDRPTLVLGDLNAGWGELEAWAGAQGLRAHRPDAPAGEVVTFPGRGDRLDWILASAHLERIEERVLPERWSDHLAVAARFRLRAD